MFAESTTIEVAILKVGKSKLSKSLLQQIDSRNPFDDLYNFTGDKIFGYVKVENKSDKQQYHKVMIYENQGMLYKYGLINLLDFSQFRPERTYQSFYNNNHRFLKAKFPGHIHQPDEDSTTCKGELGEEVCDEIQREVERVNDFLANFKSRQIFI